MEDRQEQYINEGKIFAILGYLFILCIIPLIFKKENPFVFFHSKQGLVLFLGEVAIFILSIILPIWIIKLGAFILLATSFVGILAVLQGQRLELPIVSRLADRISL
ncbi:MAG: hypothetical protein AB1650_07215 [Candidatus Omnitrophota bacterium]